MMVNSCCAIGCTNRYVKGAGISFHVFPSDENRKALWTRAIKRKNWKPSPYSVVCGQHFQTGRPNINENHPDYVPNVFSFPNGKIRNARNYEIYKNHYDKILKKQIEVNKVKVENCKGATSLQSENIVPGKKVSRSCKYQNCPSTDLDGVKMYRFPSDKTRSQLWLAACNNQNLFNLSTEKLHDYARVCEKHFQNWCFSNTTKTRLVHNAVPDKKKSEVTTSPLDISSLGLSAYKSPIKRFIKSGNVKENSSFEKKIKTGFNSNEKFLIQNKVTPSLPQRCWVLKFVPAKNKPGVSTENGTEKQKEIPSISTARKIKRTRIKKKISASTYEVSQTDANSHEYVNSMFECDENDLVSPSPLVTNNDSTLSAESFGSATDDDSTLTAESAIEDDASFNTEPFVESNENSEGSTVKRSIQTTENVLSLNPEPSTVNSKNAIVINLGSSVATENISSPHITSCKSEDAIKDTPTNTTVHALKPIEDTTESDYSYFKSSPLDTNEVLAVKLETMLAVNLALQEKIKFYRNRCRFYEKKINRLTSKRKFKVKPVRYNS